MSVPCGTCTLCCQGQREPIFIKPEEGDDALAYVTRIVRGQLALEVKENGDCVHLDRERGCLVHKYKPAVCREFDCRRLIGIPPKWLDGRAIPKEVLDKGRSLLREEGYW